MKKFFLFFVFAASFTSELALSESLDDISRFSMQICDSIRTEGSISKKEITGKLDGELKGIAKLIGASVGADGTIRIDDTIYSQLPYDALPAQMQDARACRKEIAKLLIEERNRIMTKEDSTAAPTIRVKPIAAPTKIDPRDLSGTVTLSRSNGLTKSCVRFSGFPSGLPTGYQPFFHAWVRGSGVDIPMSWSTTEPCKEAYSLIGNMPPSSRGGTMSIHDDRGFIDWVLVGSFSAEKGEGCNDVGVMQQSVMTWESSGRRENAGDMKMPINGAWGWLCQE
jgi:hypothetical protein